MRNIKIPFLMILLSLYSVSASEPDKNQHLKRDSRFFEPLCKSSSLSSYDNIEETPAQKVLKLQSETIVKKNFVRVFGEEIVNKLEIDWDIFQNTNLAFDHFKKREYMRAILALLKKNSFSSSDNDLQLLYSQVLVIRDQIENVHVNRLEKATENYFRLLYNDQISDVSFLSKRDGDQLGRVFVIQHKELGKITYHIKTHSNGTKSNNSMPPQQADPKELFVYKLLEKLEIGCNAHLYGRDLNNFYIATKDAGYNEQSKKQGEFSTYECFKQNKDVNEIIENKNISDGFIKTDILSRVLGLSDVLNNGGNVGITSDNKFKIIDFRLCYTLSYENKLIGKDWESGNNKYNYNDTAILKILKNVDFKDKIEKAYPIMEELKDFDKHTNIVLNKTKEILEPYEFPEEQFKDLEFYKEKVNKNFEYLSKFIEENYLFSLK